MEMLRLRDTDQRMWSLKYVTVWATSSHSQLFHILVKSNYSKAVKNNLEIPRSQTMHLESIRQSKWRREPPMERTLWARWIKAWSCFQPWSAYSYNLDWLLTSLSLSFLFWVTTFNTQSSKEKKKNFPGWLTIYSNCFPTHKFLSRLSMLNHSKKSSSAKILRKRKEVSCLVFCLFE